MDHHTYCVVEGLINFDTSAAYRHFYWALPLTTMVNKQALLFHSNLTKQIPQALNRETLSSPCPLPPPQNPTSSYQYRPHPAPPCRTIAGPRGWCRCGTAVWTLCPSLHPGPVCGNTSPARGDRDVGREQNNRWDGGEENQSTFWTDIGKAVT